MKRVEALFNKVAIYAFLLLISCSDDDAVNSNIPNNPSNPPVVEAPASNQTCLIITADYPTFSYILTRNDLGLPAKLKFTKYAGKDIDHSCSFEYDDSHRLIKLRNETNLMTYRYDNLGRVISEKYEAQPNQNVPPIKDVERIFTYNHKGYLDSAYYSAEDYQRYVYDDNGNVIKSFVKYAGQPEFLVREYLEYDDKKNPFYEFSFTHTIHLNHSGVIGTTTTFNPVRHKTNVVQSKVYASDGTFTASSVTYNYNDSGYPISGNNMAAFGYQCK